MYDRHTILPSGSGTGGAMAVGAPLPAHLGEHDYHRKQAMANIGKTPIHAILTDSTKQDGKTQETRQGHTTEVMQMHSKGKQSNPSL